MVATDGDVRASFGSAIIMAIGRLNSGGAIRIVTTDVNIRLD